MNRRDFLLTSGAIAAVAAVPAKAMAIGKTVIVSDGAQSNPHLDIVLKWIRQRLNERVLYTRNEMFGDKIKLTKPEFKVVEGKRVWNWMTGDTKETGLAIFIKELGIPITTVGIATSIGYEDYFSQPRDRAKYPDYFVRSPYLSYDQRTDIEPHLPKGHIGFDDRWIEVMFKVNNG